MAKKTPEINATSTADIAFLLLVFFLATTTMNVDSGIYRRLPPYQPDNTEAPKYAKRNILQVLVNRNNQLAINGELADVSTLKDRTIEFVLNPNNSEDLPQKEIKTIDLFGPVEVSKGIVSLQSDKGTSYEMYIAVQDQLTSAYNELRNRKANEKWGKNFDELNEDQKEAVRKVVPMQISEAEPKNIGEKIMAKFKKDGKRETPAISTASLPDIVFMLLFFFMVSTTMREVSLMVANAMPQATETVKLEKKSLVSNIYVGKPTPQYQGAYGTEPRIQLNDRFATLEELGAFVVSERESRKEEDRNSITNNLKVDKNVTMGVVTDIKQELRKANSLRINYGSTKKPH